MLYYIYEDVNCTAVGAFASYAQAREWKLAHIPAHDLANAHGRNADGYAGWLIVHARKLADIALYVTYESAQACEQRYAECIAAGDYGRHVRYGDGSVVHCY